MGGKGSGKKPNLRRNERLRQAFRDGVPIQTLVWCYEITRQRLYQICRGIKRRETPQ